MSESYYERNKERLRAYQREYYAKNRDKTRSMAQREC